MAGSEAFPHGFLSPVVHVIGPAALRVHLRLRHSGDPKQDLIEEFRLPPEGTVVQALVKLLRPVTVLFVHARDRSSVQQPARDPVDRVSAHIFNEVAHLILVGARQHHDILCRAGRVGGVQVLRKHIAVPHREIVGVVHLLVDLHQLLLAQGEKVVHRRSIRLLQKQLRLRLRLLPAEGKVDGAALRDHLSEKALCLLDERQQRNAGPARGLAEDRDVVRISAELRDIALHPAQRADLVQDPQIAALLILLPARHRREIHKAHQAEAVIDRHQHDIPVRVNKIKAVIHGVRDAAPAEGAAREKHHDRPFAAGGVAGGSVGGAAGGVVLFGSEYVQSKAVFTLQVSRSRLRIALRLDRTFSVIDRLINAVIRERVHGRFPPKGADRRLRVGNASKAAHPGKIRAHKSPVIAGHR